MFSFLNSNEKKWLLLLLAAGVLDGATGILGLTDIIAKKTLSARGWQITVITMLPSFVLVLSLFWSELLKKGAHQKRNLLVVGLLGRFILLLALITRGTNGVLLLFFLYQLSSAMLIFQVTSIFEHNYRESIRGRIYGWFTSVFTLASMAATLLAGKILDADESAFRLLYAVAGIAGLGACVAFSLVTLDRSAWHASETGTEHPFRLMIASFRNAWRVLKTDGLFRRYQSNFSIYGLGFFAIVPVMPYFLVDTLHLSYGEISLGRGVIGQAGLVLLSPFLGKIMDRTKPIRFTGIMLTIFIFYPLLLGLAAFVPWPKLFVYAGFLMFGVAIAGVGLAWRLGSLYFTQGRPSAAYLTVHMSNSGLRGVAMPPVGYLIFSYLGSLAAFALSAVLFTVASFRMQRLGRRERVNGVKAKKGSGFLPGPQ